MGIYDAAVARQRELISRPSERAQILSPSPVTKFALGEGREDKITFSAETITCSVSNDSVVQCLYSVSSAGALMERTASMVLFDWVTAKSGPETTLESFYSAMNGLTQPVRS